MKKPTITYFRYERDRNRVKIGKTVCPDKRFSPPTDNSEELELIGTIDGDCEADMHRRFYDLNIRREWFDCAGGLRTFLQQRFAGFALEPAKPKTQSVPIKTNVELVAELLDVWGMQPNILEDDYQRFEVVTDLYAIWPFPEGVDEELSDDQFDAEGVDMCVAWVEQWHELLYASAYEGPRACLAFWKPSGSAWKEFINTANGAYEMAQWDCLFDLFHVSMIDRATKQVGRLNFDDVSDLNGTWMGFEMPDLILPYANTSETTSAFEVKR